MVTAAIDCSQMAESKRKRKTYVYILSILASAKFQSTANINI